VRKWTKSACVVIAWSILALLAVAGFQRHSHTVQANISTASSTQAIPVAQSATLTSVTTAALVSTALTTTPSTTWTVRPGDTLSGIAATLGVRGGWQALYAANQKAVGPDPDTLRSGITLEVPGTAAPVRYTVTPGDTLSSIASALAVPGGWQALYADNRRAIGPNPDLIRTGTVLVTPGPAAAKTAPRKAAASGSPEAGPSHPSRPPAAGRPGSAGSSSLPPTAPPASVPSSRSRTPAAGGMPAWLKDTLVSAGLLTLLAFLVEPFLLTSRRRRQAAPAAEPPGPVELPKRSEDAAERIPKIIEASYHRLIVTYSVHDDTVYLLTPPGENPRSVLRAARLVLPEDTYQELAGHLGVPAGWPTE
jgi:LysM repeat protein